ncbi:MAG: hypothetical protein JWO79_1829 [Actinomycetia bacterium]|nr:hypothetical protein [Actinomycetes bacterium]
MIAGSLVLGRPVSAWPAIRHTNWLSWSEATDTSYQPLLCRGSAVCVTRAPGRSRWLAVRPPR